jgi:hypothetical protein
MISGPNIRAMYRIVKYRVKIASTANIENATIHGYCWPRSERKRQIPAIATSRAAGKSGKNTPIPASTINKNGNIANMAVTAREYIRLFVRVYTKNAKKPRKDDNMGIVTIWYPNGKDSALGK